ncbi:MULTISPECIES: energy-coupling factor transporter transmembrane component T family protein [unclassified Leifsonia]|uniref:energy-coupling factor transporter transmembrane component T family protein n=1 Tax=unclassified Leifsonia TaxID=2663824 RepID=UPI0006F8BD6F|nr:MULTISPECIES: energy-coupling factor transporter transmembrane component T [unclassified Leifsonia]KQX07153.1 ABC transporter [Leifsonia sp. Root1293]KRA11436.1 ABC transporter [Leifsonia sp. Root60]
MSLLTPTIRPSLVARINPVAKLAAALLISITLLLSIDVVSAAVALALEAVLLGFAGLSARQFWLRTSPLWIAAPLAGLTTVLYGVDSGAVLWQWGFITVTEGSLGLGLAIMLRVLAIGLPGIVLLATTDPTDLADGLAQVVRLPSRFVLGALAGLRLVGLGIEDWRSLGLARRARGVADARGPVGALRRFAGQAFAMLVISVRRGSKLATAMEARGFGADDVERSWARPSTFGGREVVLVMIGAAIAILAVAAAVWAGTWSFVLA